tara:strand:+ start:413 stop:1207 length:795 start_codon:yes stop_codon:yes gene_type:complete
MKVSHEAPIQYMDEIRGMIDYDYCLPHLLDESEEYKKYFQQSKEIGRYIIMDNSLHELGTPYDEERLWYWLNFYKPNEFIVPDFWEDKTKTLVSAKKWLSYNYPKNTIPVAVVQAKNKIEAFSCYHILKIQGYDKIAFSYGADYYYDEGLSTTSNKDNKFITKAHGRYNVIKEFREKGLINMTDRIHLLGCNIPQEFSWYKDMSFIETIDTSNPVIHGLAGVKYKDFGLEEKLSHKVDKFKGESKNWETAIYNINKFKEFIPKK